MKYKSIKGISDCLAKFSMQDRIHERERRWVWSEADFRESDWVEIAKISKAIADVLKSASGRMWRDVVMDVAAASGIDFIGSRMQDEIIATCEHCGIVFPETGRV